MVEKKASREFLQYVLNDLLAGIEGITARPMFGGYNLYKDGVIFALIIRGNKLYFKADKQNRGDFEKFGSKQFIYQYPNSDMKIAMSYWELPADIMEDKEAIREWVEKSYRASLRSEKK